MAGRLSASANAYDPWQTAGGKKKVRSRAPTLSKEQRAAELSAELLRAFKTTCCEVDHGDDRESARRCNSIHRWENVVPRRPPFESPYYEAEVCTDELTHGTGACHRGLQCPYAHGQLEVMYHPTIYKHTLCSDGAACKRGLHCAFAHGSIEQAQALEMEREWIAARAASCGTVEVCLGASAPADRSVAAYVQSALQIEPQPAIPSPEARLFEIVPPPPEKSFEYAFDAWQSDLLNGSRGKKIQDEIQRCCEKGQLVLTPTFSAEAFGWQLVLHGPATDGFDAQVASCLNRIEHVWWKPNLLPRSQKVFPPRFTRYLSQAEGLDKFLSIKRTHSLDGVLVVSGAAQQQQIPPHTVVLWGPGGKARASALHDLDLLLSSHQHSAEREQQDALLQATKQEMDRLRAELERLALQHDQLLVDHAATNSECQVLQAHCSKLDSAFVALSKGKAKAATPAVRDGTHRNAERRLHHRWWDDAASKDEECVTIMLDESGEEWDSVHSHFIATFGPRRVRIHQIRRVQNRNLFDHHILKKRQMTLPNEKWLFHGSDWDAVNSMCSNGFNRSFAGKNATAFGKGCYFAQHSSYSNKYASRGCDGKRRMILAWVLAGRHCPGDPRMCAPLPNFDTTADRDKDSQPTIYVTYNDTQNYPAYVVVYTTELTVA